MTWWWHRHRDQLAGVLVGLVLGLVIVALFVFVFSEDAVDDASIDHSTQTDATGTLPEPVPVP